MSNHNNVNLNSSRTRNACSDMNHILEHFDYGGQFKRTLFFFYSKSREYGSRVVCFAIEPYGLLYQLQVENVSFFSYSGFHMIQFILSQYTLSISDSVWVVVLDIRL